MMPGMRSLLALGAAMLVTACVSAPPGGAGFRDQDEPLSVTTRGTSAQMQGDWVIRAAYPGDDALRAVSYAPERPGGPAFDLLWRRCDIAGTCADMRETWLAEVLGHHRWRVTGPQGRETRELWVIWVDDGFRTAAIGAPDGAYGWVLDRSAKGGADRIIAARDILDFNGYDTSALTLR